MISCLEVNLDSDQFASNLDAEFAIDIDSEPLCSSDGHGEFAGERRPSAIVPCGVRPGNLESCTANARGAAIEYNQMQTCEQSIAPSRLFIYYNERVLEGLIKQDAGAIIRSGIKTVTRQGAPPEDVWPYD
jgi:C1A family cysteine protease